LVLIIEGNLTLVGTGKITANGANSTFVGGDSSGGAGAGSMIIFCTGTITDGTFEAKGGRDNGINSPSGGGGGGGYIALIASAYAGVQTTDVTGGAAVGGAVSGSAGLAEIVTLTEAQIRALLLRSY
jgi:hypothetical protein